MSPLRHVTSSHHLKFPFQNQLQSSMGGWGVCGNWMLSPNSLKSKVPIFWGEGVGGSWKLDAESKFAKIQSSHFRGGGSWKLDAESKFAKIQSSHFRGGGEVRGNWMPSPNLLKSKVPIWGGGGVMEI